MIICIENLHTMNIVFFTHPKYLKLRSMDTYTNMLSSGMKARGHHVETWFPRSVFSQFQSPPTIQKWLGYIDQFIIFPIAVKSRVARFDKKTLFVFTDQALGPWVPLVADKSHIIHCHDFMALQSAEGEIAENPTGITGRIYQSFIKNGYKQGKNFISVSKKTKADLKRYLTKVPERNEVVYNGLKPEYRFTSPEIARTFMKNETGLNLDNGYLLHVGGNQWYKNRKGLIEIYNAFRQNSEMKIPLLLVGQQPSAELWSMIYDSAWSKDIHVFTEPDDQFIQHAYSGSAALLFPSLAEGFGWPILEAMACGTIVITTNAEPMIEIGGNAALYINKRPEGLVRAGIWALESAKVVEQAVCLSPQKRKDRIEAGLVNASCFSLSNSLDKIEAIYLTLTEKIS
jgi:glycosyltransferase involved in cell wall biosynthesis